VVLLYKKKVTFIWLRLLHSRKEENPFVQFRHFEQKHLEILGKINNVKPGTPRRAAKIIKSNNAT
jgi:hypothetical protein